VASGLAITLPVTNSLTIGQGATYEYKAISDSIATTVIKQALFLGPQTFTFTPPAVAGQSVIYTIEGTYTEFTNANMSTSTVPYLDANNSFLPSILLNAELRLSVNTNGVPATTGTQVAPATTAGTFPVYNVTFTNGVANPVISLHPNSPYFPSVNLAVTPIPHTTNGATQSITNDTLAFSFADAATNSVVLPVSLDTNTINPYKPITLKLKFAPSAASGAFSVALSYAAYGAGDSITTARTTTTTEVISVTTSINTVQENTLATAVIPNTAFAGFTGGSWKLTKDRLTVVLSRLGSDTGDTNVGTMSLFEVQVTQ
jgi:hypothetical protein